MYDLCWALDRVTRPLLHTRPVYVLLCMLKVESVLVGASSSKRGTSTHIEGHPRDRFVVWNIRLLDQVQAQCFIVELDSEYSAWRGPGANHEMVLHLGLDCCCEALNKAFSSRFHRTRDLGRACKMCDDASCRTHQSRLSTSIPCSRNESISNSASRGRRHLHGTTPRRSTSISNHFRAPAEQIGLVSRSH